MSVDLLLDPVKFVKLCWPDLNLYDKQVEILESLRDNDETIVPAGNQLGKDFISGIAVLWFFCSRTPCRVVTSSAGQSQLKAVLWGEMRRFVNTSRFPLPIQMNDMLIRKKMADGSFEPRSYIQGTVTNVPENMLGHHLERDELPRTLAIFDEASSIGDEYYNASDTWAHRKLVIGNPLPCANFFYRGVKEGNLKAETNGHLYRSVIKIKAEDSPNVQYALAEIKAGKEPSYRQVLPGVVDYRTYLKRRQLWDKVRQCVGLDAEFYEGAEVLLFPPEQLNISERRATEITGKREAKAMGVDPAEGGDSTVWTIIDELGVLYQLSMKTPDTATIAGRTIALMKEYRLSEGDVFFDRGGGGKQHADYLRTKGYRVKTVGFGEAATDPNAYRRRAAHMRSNIKREELVETKYTYKNRRAEMYGLTSQLVSPDEGEVFAIPAEYAELRRQLAPLPRLYDPEGRMYLPPKRKLNKNSNEVTLEEMLGCSPDEADSLVLAVYGMVTKPVIRKLGAC